ncbi:hypothetical protein [Citrobacter koseri]|uniref:hypothetical protein n=1 Tax=Citrobacter koseri TaxID=545 RepID=UPI00192C1F2F|nr:hypothetical protein [Citrobacter koseri]MBL4564210.1 hypothetical protein [Citrobacter koseri]
MESGMVINYEENFQCLCSDFERKLKQTNKQDGLSEAEIGSVLASGQKWASDFFRQFGENDVEAQYNTALIQKFEQLCHQADRDGTMTGTTDIAVGLDTLSQIFRKQGRVREACKYLAIACGYLELKKDLSILYNVALSFTEQKISEQRTSRARKGGLARGRIFEPARQKVIELLETTEKPEEGWSFKEEAFDAIDEALRNFIDEEGIALKDSDLRARVLRWSNERPNVKKAFARVVTNKIL